MTESELPLRLRENWFIACPSGDLREKPLSRTLLGNHLVLFRGVGGAAAALIDRCAHRNMRLSAGVVRSGAVECPYHGWTYDGSGRCTAIPALEEPPPIAVRAYRTAESDGYVWVYLGDGPPRTTQFRFPHCGEKGWTTFRMETRFAASAFACLENFLDVPHTAYVHSGWFRSRASRQTRAVVRREGEGSFVEFDETPERRSLVARLLFPRTGRLRHTDRFVMPSTSRVDYDFGPERHFIITSQCTPVSEHETDVYTVITFRFGMIAPLVRLLFEPMSRRIIRQDVAILGELTRQIDRFGGNTYRFVSSDLLGPEILRHWRAAVEGRVVEESSEEVTLRF